MKMSGLLGGFAVSIVVSRVVAMSVRLTGRFEFDGVTVMA